MKKIFILAFIALLAAACNISNPGGENGGNSQSPQSQEGQNPSGGQYSLQEVQSANSRDKCWTLINGKVYDLTEWIGKHPGGPGGILAICGKDGTAAFSGQHGGKPGPEKELEKYEIGVLK